MDNKDNTNVIIDLDEINDKLVISSSASVRITGEVNNNRTIEIVIGRDSELKMCIIHRNGSLIQKNIAKENARIYSTIIYTGKGSARIANILDGDGSKVQNIQIFAINNKSELNIDTTLLQAGKRTSGNILVKGTVKDAAVARVGGMIKIGKNASGSDSSLGGHVLLLNPGARAETNPQLEIENNDICSRHSASVSQIDENKLFYLMARGLPRENAKKLVVEGFLNSVIERIDDNGMKERAKEVIAGAI